MILKSTSIFTSDSDKAFSGYVVIDGNKIAKVAEGDDYDQYVDENTEVIDCGDKTISPGFIDSHTHFYLGVVSDSDLMNTDLIESTSAENCIEMMKEFERQHPDYDRLLGMGWYLAYWNDAPLPSKESLDEAFPDKPVYLVNADAHTTWMNTKAIEEAGYAGNTDYDNENILRDENGELTGIFKEAESIDIQSYKLPMISNDVFLRIIKETCEHANSLGLTSLSDMNGYYFNDFSENLYGMAQTLEKEGDMTVRMHIYPELAADRSNEKALELKKRINSEVVRISGLKGFLDGVAATYTALLIDPYTDRPDTCGIDVPKVTVEELEEYVLRSNKSGLSVRLHAIGDGAVRMALDAFEKSKKAGYTDGVVNVIEHIEEILPEDIPRFKEIGVVGCMQPAHLLLDYEEKPVRVGDRAKLMWAHRTLLDAGMDLAFSTDFPIIPLGPYRDLYVATTRKTESGEDTGTNQEEEKITLEEAITAYTKTSAKAIGRDDIGVLKEGNLADIVIHDRDLFACDLDDIKDVRPFMTIMDGKVVYKK